MLPRVSAVWGEGGVPREEGEAWQGGRLLLDRQRIKLGCREGDTSPAAVLVQHAYLKGRYNGTTEGECWQLVRVRMGFAHLMAHSFRSRLHPARRQTPGVNTGGHEGEVTHLALLSPVTTITRMPARWQTATAALTSSRGGSSMPTTPMSVSPHSSSSDALCCPAGSVLNASARQRRLSSRPIRSTRSSTARLTSGCRATTSPPPLHNTEVQRARMLSGAPLEKRRGRCSPSPSVPVGVQRVVMS